MKLWDWLEKGGANGKKKGGKRGAYEKGTKTKKQSKGDKEEKNDELYS